MLIRKLPEDSRTVAAERGGVEHWGWTTDRHLMATLVDAMQTNTYAFISANSKRKPKAPKFVPRPTDKEMKRREKENNMFAIMVKKQMNKLKQTDGKTKIVIDE